VNTRADSRTANRGFWLVAVVFATPMAFALVPTPLWNLYREQQGFSTLTVTFAFSVYAIGVLGSLLFGGQASDIVGRRPVIGAAIVLELVSATIFSASANLIPVLVARFVCGVGIGLVTASAGAYLVDLDSRARPDSDRTRANVVSTAATMGGFAAGAISAGLVVQTAPAPLRTPYLLYILFLLAAGAALATAPQQSIPRGSRQRWRPQTIRIPSEGRPAFIAAVTTLLAVNSLFGTVTVLAPSMLSDVLGQSSPLVAGSVVGAMFLSSATAQILLARLTVRTQIAAGWTMFVAGMTALVIGLSSGMLGAFVIGAALGGAGGGILFKAAIAIGATLGDPKRRGETMAGLYVAFYLGITFPVVGMGALALTMSLQQSLLIFALASIAAVSGGAVGLLQAGRCAPDDVPPNQPTSGPPATSDGSDRLTAP
jgi:MFS family permease